MYLARYQTCDPPESPSLLNLLSIAIETVLARDGLPVIQLATCQLIPNAKKKLRDLPESGTNLVTL